MQKSEISPHDRFFSTDIICDICDKYKYKDHKERNKLAQKGNQLLTDCLVGSIDVTMAEEDAYAKLVDVAADNHVGVAEKVDSSLVTA